MIKRKSDVKSKLEDGGKREIVGIAEYWEFETLDEALNGGNGVAGLGDAEVLRLVNVQNKTNALNAIRAGATAKPTKMALTMKAIQTIPATELADLQQDPAKLERRIQEVIKELEAKSDEDRKNRAKALSKQAEDEGADEDDDDDTDGK
jgi:hypothetical protein